MTHNVPDSDPHAGLYYIFPENTLFLPNITTSGCDFCAHGLESVDPSSIKRKRLTLFS